MHYYCQFGNLIDERFHSDTNRIWCDYFHRGVEITRVKEG